MTYYVRTCVEVPFKIGLVFQDVFCGSREVWVEQERQHNKEMSPNEASLIRDRRDAPTGARAAKALRLILHARDVARAQRRAPI